MAANVALPPRPAALPRELTGWLHRAACADVPGGVETMFPPDGRSTAARVAWENQAKAICGPCLVRDRCLATALWRAEEYGVWGGMTADERTALGVPSGGDPGDVLALAHTLTAGGGGGTW